MNKRLSDSGEPRDAGDPICQLELCAPLRRYIGSRCALAMVHPTPSVPIYSVMPGDVVFRHSNLTWHNFIPNLSYSKFSLKKIVRILRIRIDPFAIALFGFVTST